MKYYSEVLNKLFITETDLIAAEARQKENDSKKTVLQEKVREARKVYDAAVTEYLDCLRRQSKNNSW